MTIRETAFRLENEAGLPIRCDLRRPEGDGPFPAVVVLHGFKGFKDWGMFPPTARRLAERGLAAVSMNASMNGVGEDLLEFTELEKFGRNTVGREVGDLERVIDAVAAGEVDPAIDSSRIGLLGHSRGGGVVLLAAGGDERVKCVVTWSSIASFYRWSERALEEWRAKGRLDVPNLRTGQVLWMDREVLEDLEANREAYDLSAACRRVVVPFLALHGEQDEAVRASDADRLVAWAGSREKRAVKIPNTGHTFGAVHPWKGPTAAWEKVVEETGAWFSKWLGAAEPPAADA